MIEMHSFNNYGFLLHKFSEEDLSPVREEVNFIKKSFDTDKVIEHNKNLAGNIKREFKLISSVQHLHNIISPLIKQYDNHFGYLSSHDTLIDNAPIVLHSPWVNFQKKHEFNPNHNHKGIVSFVIWLEIPYLIEDELENSPGKNSNSNLAGHFEFSYTDVTGRIRQHPIPVDKKMENTICLFPAKTIHTVYPFYTSDDYRITISGNFYFDIR